MKKFQFLLAFGSFCILLYSCKPEIEEAAPLTAGTAHFSSYAAIGGSLTAGVSNNGLNEVLQENSYPSLLARRMELVGGGEFKNPLMPEGGVGELVLDGFLAGCPGTDPFPILSENEDNPEWKDNIAALGPFHNLAIPRMKAKDIDDGTWINFPLNNIDSLNDIGPYLGRLVDADNTTYRQFVLHQINAIQPDFYTFWMGSEDITLFAATGGGYLTADLLGNGTLICDAPELGNLQYTPVTDYKLKLESFLNDIFAAMPDTAQGFIFNVPDPTSLPYFQALHGSLLANQYEATHPDIPTTDTLEFRLPEVCDSFAVVWITTAEGIRPGRETDRVLLPAGQTLGKASSLSCPGVPPQSRHGLSPENPLTNSEVLDSIEIAVVKNVVEGYNTAITDVAEELHLHIFDAAGVLGRLTSGFSYNGADFNGSFIQGGIFGLDGLHPTPRGYALFTNEILGAINATYGSNLPYYDPMRFEGIKFP